MVRYRFFLYAGLLPYLLGAAWAYARGGNFDVRLCVEQPADPFANEVVVLRQNKPNRHFVQHMTALGPRP